MKSSTGIWFLLSLFALQVNAAEPCVNLAGKYLATLDAKTKILFELRQEACNYGFVKVTTIDARGVTKPECPATVILDNMSRLVVDDLTASLKVDSNGFSGIGKTKYMGVTVNIDAKAQLDSRNDLAIDVVAKSSIGIPLKRVQLLGVRQAKGFVVPTNRNCTDCTDQVGISLLELLLLN